MQNFNNTVHYKTIRTTIRHGGNNYLFKFNRTQTCINRTTAGYRRVHNEYNCNDLNITLCLK